MSNHTPEPWFVAEKNKVRLDCAYLIRPLDGKNYEYGAALAATNQEDARRIVSCVNFCAGVSTENLENNEKLLWLAEQYNTVKSLRDELLTALEAHEKFWTIREAELGELSPEAKAVRDAGLAAIAKAKGGAA